MGEFLILLQKSYAYLRKHRYRVLSTELPDDLLQKWLMPMPDEKQAEEYKRSFARQNDTLSQTQLPVFVFDHVLQKRFNRDISTFDDAEMEIAGRGFKNIYPAAELHFRNEGSGTAPDRVRYFRRGELRRNHRTNRSAGNRTGIKIPVRSIASKVACSLFFLLYFRSIPAIV